VPHEGVPDDLHVVAQSEIHQRIRGREVVSVRAFPRMDELPFHVVLSRDLVEVLLEDLDILRIQLGTTAEAGVTRHHAPVHRRADGEVVFENVLQRSGGFSGASRRRHRECERREQTRVEKLT